VPADGFTARYAGLLLIQSPGRHNFFARTDGSVILTVAGRVVLDGAAADARSTACDLPAGLSPIVLEYRHTRGEAHLAIDWEGPGFGREPLPARLLFHEPGPDHPVSTDRFEDGRRLADRLGCAGCHRLLDLPRHPHLGPPLADAGRTIAADWLSAWLTDPARVRPKTRMPALTHSLKPADIADLTAFLASLAGRPTQAVAEVKMALNVARPDKGRLLFRAVGCLGCHTRGAAAGATDEPAAPDLADLGRKRTMDWLADYLHHPRRGSPARHRADLRLSPDDAAHLAAYLVTDPPPLPPAQEPAPRSGVAARGKELAVRLRCAACHDIPGLEAPKADLALTSGSRPDAGCLADAEAPARAGVPRFALGASQRTALRDLVAGLPRDPAATPPETLAADTVRRLNCLGCHRRDGQGGDTLGAQLAAMLAADPELGVLKGTLTPPDLSAVGDKLRSAYLAQAVRGAAPAARPWLSVRMPAFSFEPGEAEALVQYFQGCDRMEPVHDAPEPPTQPDPAAFETAVALIGQRGFGCVNCHVLAGKIPPGGEPETLGPDLALAQRRMTARYFDRWIGNPQRIIPGTPMPQFVQPVATVAGTLDQQLATLWQLLGSTRVAEAAAQGTREILKRQGDRAMVVRDMVLLPDAPETIYTPRAVAIGLKNDHALLFDTDRLTWLAAWHRGFLYRTKSGRLWEWHPEGERLWLTARRQPPVVFLDSTGKALLPGTVRDRFGHFAELDFVGAGIRLTYELNPAGPAAAAPTEVAESIQPTESGWERTVQLVRAPAGGALRPAAVVQAPAGSTQATTGGTTRFTWTSDGAHVSLSVLDAVPAAATLPDDPTAYLFSFLPGKPAVRIVLAVRPGP
jgi:mono/diheme cytochrome c family protein